MGMLSYLGLRESATPDLTVELGAAQSEVEVLREGLADLELALEDEGWQRLTTSGDREFTRSGLGQAATVARVMACAHPLIKRGLGVRQAYVFGQGVQVQARADGTDGAQDVNAVVQAFWDDEGNVAAMTGAQAQEELERALGTDGNVFLAHFTSPLTGFVQVRSLPFDEITDVICNPDDRDDPWYYRRQWTQVTITPDGRTGTKAMTAFYPSMRYRPTSRPRYIDGNEIMWDAPVLHLSVNRLDGWAFGIGDAYAALPFARMYRDFIVDWAVLVKSLSQFAWRATAKGSKAQQLRAKVSRATTNAPAGNPNTIGATATMSSDTTLEAIPKSGATIDSESGRPIAALIAAAFGVPVTILLADPGQTGARAVAETLDQPMRLMMLQRQGLWAAAYRASMNYVIKQAVKAPRGPLRGNLTRDPYIGREMLTLAGDTDPTVEITFPPLDELPMETIVKSIVAADGTGKLPPLEVVKLLLRALSVKDVDEILADMVDDQGQFIDPSVNAGTVAVRAFRAGQDPATAVDPPADPAAA